MSNSKYTTKKSISMQRSRNNPSVSANTYEDTKKLTDAENIMELDSTRPTNIGYIVCDVTYGTHVSFTTRSDLHFASAKPEVLKTLDEYYKNTITSIIDHGDMLQTAVEGHHQGEALESRLSPDEERLLFKKSLSQYPEKVVAACGGNHDDPEFANRLKDHGVSMLKATYEEFGIPYHANSLVVEFRVPVVKSNKIVGKTSLWCVVMHCNGRTSAKKLASVAKTYDQGLGVIERFNYLYGKNITPDFILGGHFHANADTDYLVERNIYDEKGKAIGSYMHTIRVRSNSTLQDSFSSAFNRSFPGVLIPNFTQFDVHFEVNPNYEPTAMNTAPKYIPVVTEFNILNKSGELSIPAKQYMQVRKDYDFTNEVRKEQEGQKSILKVVKEVEKQSGKERV